MCASHTSRASASQLDGRRSALGFVDLIFAVDSTPAIYGLTEDANASRLPSSWR